MRALKQLEYNLCDDEVNVTTQAREGIETIIFGVSNSDTLVTTQAREGIETYTLGAG